MKKYLFSSFLILAIFISCKETNKVAENTPSQIPSWKYEIRSVQGKPLNSKQYISFIASENKISGKTACNGYSGGYTIEKNTINFGPLAATKMYCEEHVMKAENSFFSALNNTSTFVIDNNMLTLVSGDTGAVMLKAFKIKN